METILWTQNETPDAKETFVIDGNISAYEGSVLQDEAFARLLAAREHKSKFFAEGIKIMQEKHPDLHLSENLQCYQSSKGTLIQASYNEKDESGRRMPYIFFANTVDWKTISRLLGENSQKINRTCYAKDLEALESLSEKLSKKKRTVIWGSIVSSTILLITLVIVILLWNR